MNKRQLIVAWMMILSIALSIIRTIMILDYYLFKSIFQFYSSLFYIIMIGGALIFILRNRNK